VRICEQCPLLALRVTYGGAAIRPELGAKRKRPVREVAEADSRVIPPLGGRHFRVGALAGHVAAMAKLEDCIFHIGVVSIDKLSQFR
jgi:hypothetical protein